MVKNILNASEKSRKKRKKGKKAHFGTVSYYYYYYYNVQGFEYEYSGCSLSLRRIRETQSVVHATIAKVMSFLLDGVYGGKSRRLFGGREGVNEEKLFLRFYSKNKKK